MTMAYDDFTLTCLKHDYTWFDTPEKVNQSRCYHCAQEQVLAALQALRDALDQHPWASRNDGLLGGTTTMQKLHRPLKMLENVVRNMPEPKQPVPESGAVSR